jgi:hypothetical protein
LRGRVKPRIRALLSQNIENVAEHPLEWVLTHVYNLRAGVASRHAGCHVQ